jgi:uncharacterized membrane protein
VGRKPAHLFLGLYASLDGAERDLDGLKKLHAEGLAGAYDAAVVTRDADGTPRVARKKHAGHPVWAGAGIGALVGVLFPLSVVPIALAGAGTGALVRHAQGSLLEADAEELAESLASGEAALVVVGDAAMNERLEQVFPGAARRIAKPLDMDADDFAEALLQASDEA